MHNRCKQWVHVALKNTISMWCHKKGAPSFSLILKYNFCHKHHWSSWGRKYSGCCNANGVGGAGFPVMKEEAVNKVGRTGGGQKHRENVLNQSKNAQPFHWKPLFCPISFCLLLCLKFQLKQPSLFAFAFVCCKCRAPFVFFSLSVNFLSPRKLCTEVTCALLAWDRWPLCPF